MVLINTFAHPYATVRRSFFPFNSLIPFPILILTPIHSRCATCTVEMPTLINGSTLKLATTLELSTALVVAAASVDASSSGIEQMREAWEIHRKSYTVEFFELDPCTHELKGNFKSLYPQVGRKKMEEKSKENPFLPNE
ncbi:hypothetical protein JHK85_000498 [Glycine max]|nr:hypothetical protein JHK85_000498 [Glycine max]KAG5087879.1 hypothetical protein JHK86_000491 [Glycine max]